MLGKGKFLFWPLLPVIFCQRQLVQSFIERIAELMYWIGNTAGIGARSLIGFKVRTKRN